MVREEYFTSLAKLGSGKVKYFTTELFSRVCSVQTLKTPKYHGLSRKKPNIKMIINIMIE
jgi:hypothetical protein